jgi:hypothetical protein
MFTATASEAGLFRQRASNISRALRALQAEVENAPRKWNFSGELEQQFRIFVATSRADRERAYRLAHQVYAKRGYVPDACREMIVSPFDAQPQTFTLLAEDKQGRAAGTITLVFDAEAGLPCDEIFHSELDGLRASGRRLVEVTRLAIDEEHTHCKALLVHFFNFIYIYTRRVCAYTDFVIEVNPRHVLYYRRLLGFEALGPERPCPRVQGAPAVLLRLNLDLPKAEVRRVAGQRDAASTRSLYPYFYAESAEPPIAELLAQTHTPMTEADARYFNLLAANAYY